MNDLEKKLKNLEFKIYQNEPSEISPEGLLTQARILESLATFYESTEMLSRIGKVKKHLESKIGYSIYKTADPENKIERINEKVNKLLDTNLFMNECVLTQGELVNTLDVQFGSVLEDSSRTNEELARYRKYLQRKNKTIRTIAALFIVLFILLFIKIFW